MEVAVLVFAGVLVGGAWSAPTFDVATPELILQPPVQGPAIAVPATYVSRHHAQDELGRVNYGFSHPGQAKNELRDASGNVAGVYTYIDADDKVIRVEYTAGEGGFQVRSNNLPVAVKDTPEVLAAKLQFVEAYNAAALAAATAADDNLQSTDSEAINIANPVPVISSPVRDTPEVLAAKLQFVEAYNAAALAAANAPDDPLVDSTADTKFKITASVNYNPVRDTPEVIAAKLQFVEAYNAAALAATTPAVSPEADDASKATIVYTTPAVQDTPEVIAAKLKFVESYNAAAIAAALAPDDNVVYNTSQEDTTEELTIVTDKPSEVDEPVTNLRGISEQETETTISPNDDDVQTTTLAPIKVQEQKENKKVHVLVPTKVIGSPNNENTESIFTFRVPQAPAYNVIPPVQPPTNVEGPVVLPPVQPSTYVKTPALLPPVQPATIFQPNFQDPVAAIPVTYVSKHHAQDELGQVNYGFSYPGQAKNELRDASGNVAGVYTYTDAEDKVIRVEYTAGENGFQVKSNNLPVAVRDTPEVLAAKLQFVEAYNAAALAAAAAPDYDDGSLLETGEGPVSNPAIFVAPSPVKDTPEVIAAKLQFVEAYNAAALAAASAPDDPPVDSSADDKPKTATFVNHNPVRDTPEVTAAKLQFVEAYNAAALAAADDDASPEADDTLLATIVYATHSVQDTPEVIAAKLQFVEAYNAAALAAALAPDDVEDNNTLQVDTTEEPEDVDAVTDLWGINVKDPSTEIPHEEDVTEPTAHDTQVSEDSQDLDITELPEVSQTLDDLGEVSQTAGTTTLNVVPQSVVDTVEVTAAKAQFKTAYDSATAAAEAAPYYDLDGSLSRYSGYLLGPNGALSPLYTNSFPYGVYSLHTPIIGPINSLPQTTPVNKVSYTPYLLPVPLPYQSPANSKQVPVYAPSYTYYG